MSSLVVAGVCLASSVVLTVLLIRSTPANARLIWERDNLSWVRRTLAVVAGLLAFFGLWYLGNAFNPVGPTRIPTPVQTVVALGDLLAGGGWLSLGTSALRVVASFTAAAFLSVALAYIFAVHSVSAGAFAPPISFIRYVPPTAFTALLVIYFGIDEAYKFAVMFVGVFFFNFRMTMDIIEDFDVRYVDLARLTGASYKRGNNPWWLVAQTVLPGQWPRVWDTLRINLSFAWTFLVVAESVGLQTGLGRDLITAQRFLQVEQVYACILLFGIVGYLSDLLMARAKTALFPWHSDATKR